ncbi:MAG: hypothetical protein ABI347_02720 [Nitrososphaera sp.]|jgi:hypothetical protein
MASARWTAVAIVGVFLIALGFSLPLAVSMFANPAPTSESFGLRGRVDMTLYDQSGQVKDERHLDNLIVGAGVEGVAFKIAPFSGSVVSSTPYNYIALGTGNTAVDSSQTALAAELPVGASYGRLQDPQAIYSTSSGNKLILSVTFAPGQGTGTLRESGLFDASTAGNMLARQTFADIQKAAGDTLTVTWTITLSPT